MVKKRRKQAKIIRNRMIVVLVGISLLVAIVFLIGKVFGIGNDGEAVDDTSSSLNIEIDENSDESKDTTAIEIEDEKVVENTKITISAVGDIMFHPKEINGAYDSETDTYDFKPFFEDVKKILEKADLAVCNYEGTCCGDDIYRYQGYPIFNAPDEVLDAIKYAGFDMICTINNHTLDTGKTGIIRTYEKINDRSLQQVGTNLSADEQRVEIVDVKGIKVAFLAYTQMLNGLDSRLTEEEYSYMVNVFDEIKIKEDVAYAEENGADVIIMFAHWGYEYHREAVEYQKTWADFCLKNGVDIILGSHPHVIEPFEYISADESEYGEEKFIAYSMGNFVSNQRMEEAELPAQTEDGVITTITIEKNGETGDTEILKVDYDPTWVYRTFDGNYYHYEILLVDENLNKEDLSESTINRLERSKKDTTLQLEYVDNSEE